MGNVRSLVPPWLGLVALTTSIGLTAVVTEPHGMHSGSFWAQGLAAGALLVAPRRQRPYVVIALAVGSAVVFGAEDYPLTVALGYAAGIALGAFLAARTLTAGWKRTPRLVENDDLGRFSAACAIAGLVAAAIFGTTVALTSYASPWKVAAAVLVSHTVTCAIGLGLFTQAATQTPYFSQAHRALIWAGTVAISVFAFSSETTVLAFLVIPALGWMAFNGRMTESVLQIIAVATIAGSLSNAGHGPFAHPSLQGISEPEFQQIPLTTFLLACVLVAIPLPMSVALQRRSEAQAIQQRNHSSRLVENIRGVGIIQTDQLGAITLFNPGAQRIFGYTPEEVHGRTTEMFHSPEEIARQATALGREPTYAAILEALPTLGPNEPHEWKVVRKDGVQRVLSAIINEITDENGALVGYVATADDITDQLETQAAWAAALAKEREAVRRLTEVDHVKDRFVSSVSHELRTPITNIVGYLELLMEGVYGAPTEAQVEAMSRIEMNSRRLLTLIDDLLTLSRMENMDLPRDVAPVDLGIVIRRAEEIVRPGLRQRDLELCIDVPPAPVVIPGDAGQLERLVINLATNAVKFTPDGGRVDLRLLPPMDGSGPVIEVADTGIGIPAEDQDMLFSRFFRATRARDSAVPGSGLGLSIAKSIAEVHGGQISATSVDGSGSTFRVQFGVQDAQR